MNKKIKYIISKGYAACTYMHLTTTIIKDSVFFLLVFVRRVKIIAPRKNSKFTKENITNKDQIVILEKNNKKYKKVL